MLVFHYGNDRIYPSLYHNYFIIIFFSFFSFSPFFLFLLSSPSLLITVSLCASNAADGAQLRSSACSPRQKGEVHPAERRPHKAEAETHSEVDTRTGGATRLCISIWKHTLKNTHTFTNKTKQKKKRVERFCLFVIVFADILKNFSLLYLCIYLCIY